MPRRLHLAMPTPDRCPKCGYDISVREQPRVVEPDQITQMLGRLYLRRPSRRNRRAHLTSCRMTSATSS